MRFNTFGDCAREEARRLPEFRTASCRLDAPEDAVALQRAVERFPFVPSDPAKLREHCYEAYNIQVQGLATRLMASRTERAVIGVLQDEHDGAVEVRVDQRRRGDEQLPFRRCAGNIHEPHSGLVPPRFVAVTRPIRG